MQILPRIYQSMPENWQSQSDKPDLENTNSGGNVELRNEDLLDADLSAANVVWIVLTVFRHTVDSSVHALLTRVI